MRALARLLALALGLWLAAASGAFAASAFSNWSAVVVAGDWRAHDGSPSEGFDNARRDVSTALVRAGFPAENIRQFSVRPQLYPDTRPAKAEIRAISETLKDLASKTAGGCLFYISSHGAPQGAVLDEGILLPGTLGSMLDQSCGARPTVVVISACFSGVFVPTLDRPNRMILTAARHDRTSFGCGQGYKYPFFDDCFLSSMPGAHDFQALSQAVIGCVRKREEIEHMSPPSEPQFKVGPGLRFELPMFAFESAPKPAS